MVALYTKLHFYQKGQNKSFSLFQSKNAILAAFHLGLLFLLRQNVISNNVVCATSKASDQPAQSDQSLCQLLEYSMTVKHLTEHHLEFLSLKGASIGL